MRLALTATLSLPLLLTGCALTNTATPGTSAGALLKGNVHGGQQPVVGAHVYFFAANTTGYGQPSVSLLNANTDGTDSLGSYVLTDANGGFSITGDYTCTAGSQVYLLATGGNPGLPAPQTNPNLALMTALGQCPASGSFAATIPTVAINEVTTIASVYAISGFMTDLTHVSSSGTPLAQTGIANAFATTNNLVDITTGTALATTPAGNGVVPQAEINTLANIIATCVNSTGAGSTPCTTLFSTALNGATQPTDTVTAALNIAHYPATGAATLYALTSATPPFAPALTTPLGDFAIAIIFTGGGMQNPNGIAIDSQGDIWLSNFGGSSITKLSSQGAPLSPPTGYPDDVNQFPEAIAIDPNDNVWVANTSESDVANLAKFSNSGAQLAPPGGYTGGGLQDLLGPIAIDGLGDVWTIFYNASANTSGIVKFSNSGLPLSPPTGFGGTGIAIDASGNAWVSSPAIVERISPSGLPLYTAPVGAIGLDQFCAVAIDASGDAWVANCNGFINFKELSGTGTAISTGFTPPTKFPGGLQATIAIDGSGNAWSSDWYNLVELSNSGSAISPSMLRLSSFFTGATYLGPVAIDGSGNVWSVWYSPFKAVDNNTVEFVGAATPVVTPIAAGAANNTLGTRP